MTGRNEKPASKRSRAPASRSGAGTTSDRSEVCEPRLHQMELAKGVSEEEMVATLVTSPFPRHATMQAHYSRGVVMVEGWPQPHFVKVMDQLTAAADRLEKGQVRDLLDMLSAQARTLDAMADKLMRRAEGAVDNLEVFERLTRLALKAQANSRATIEALSKIMRGGEQVVRHVHVNEGGQAVIAGTFNHGRALPKGEGENPNSEGQSDAAPAT